MRCGRCTRSLLSIAHGNRLSAPVPPVDSRDERNAARSPQPADAIDHAPVAGASCSARRSFPGRNRSRCRRFRICL